MKKPNPIKEKWKYFITGEYRISNLGNVKTATGKVVPVKQYSDGNLYVHVEGKPHKICSLVVEYFMGGYRRGVETISFKNGDPAKCTVDNIELKPIIFGVKNPGFQRTVSSTYPSGFSSFSIWLQKRKTAVIQCSQNYQIIKIHPTLKEAAEEVSRSPSGISKVLRGKSKTSGGYYWFYLTKPPRIFYKRNPDFNYEDYLKPSS